MHGMLKTGLAERWLWRCPLLGIVLAAAVLRLLGLTLRGALPAALLLVCPALLGWGAVELWLDARRRRAARKNPNR